MVRNILWLLCFYLLVSCAARVSEDTNKAYLRYKIGTGYLKSGNYSQALSELTIASQLDPNDHLIQNNLGVTYFLLQKPSQSLTHFKKAISIKPDFTDALNNLGKSLIHLELSEEAITHLQKASKDLTYPNPEKIYSSLGIAYFNIKKFNIARNYLLKSLKIRRRHCLTNNYYARTLFEIGKYQDSTLAFDQASDYCRKVGFDEPVYYGAIAYFKINQTEEAEARFEEVVEKYPEGKYHKQSKQMLKIIREQQ